MKNNFQDCLKVMPKRRRLSSNCSMSNSNRPKASLKIKEVWWRHCADGKYWICQYLPKSQCSWSVNISFGSGAGDPYILIRIRIRIRIQEAHQIDTKNSLSTGGKPSIFILNRDRFLEYFSFLDKMVPGTTGKNTDDPGRPNNNGSTGLKHWIYRYSESFPHSIPVDP